METDTVIKSAIPSKNFDIDTVAACDAGADLELHHPTTDEPTGIFVGIVGKDGKIWQGILARNNNAERQRQYQAEKRGKKAEPKTYEQNIQEGTEMVASGTTHWYTVTRDAKGEIIAKRDTINFDGVELTWSEDNAIKYLGARPQFKTQVDEGIADLSNFIKS